MIKSSITAFVLGMSFSVYSAEQTHSKDKTSESPIGSVSVSILVSLPAERVEDIKQAQLQQAEQAIVNDQALVAVLAEQGLETPQRIPHQAPIAQSPRTRLQRNHAIRNVQALVPQPQRQSIEIDAQPLEGNPCICRATTGFFCLCVCLLAAIVWGTSATHH